MSAFTIIDRITLLSPHAYGTVQSFVLSAEKFKMINNDDTTGTAENAGLENTGPSYRWVENARPVAMERRCKTEMDVVVRCRKHTRTGNILYAVINSYRKNTRY